jgi:hypothetical protein
MDTLNIVSEETQISLVTSIICGLTYYVNELINIFRNKLTMHEKKIINKKRKKPKSILDFDNKEIITWSQIEQIRDYRYSIQYELAELLNKIYDINTNDMIKNNIDELSKKLNIQIIIYNENRNQIYKTLPADIQIKLLYYNRKFYYINRETIISEAKINRINNRKLIKYKSINEIKVN